MTELTDEQQAAVDDITAQIEDRRSRWLALYDASRNRQGIAVRMHENPELGRLWSELTQLRDQRTALVESYTNGG